MITGLQLLRRIPRLVAYAMLAALVTTVLLAADGAYRWHRESGTRVASPLKAERPVDAPDPEPVDAQPAIPASPVVTRMPGRDAEEIERPVDDQARAARMPEPASGSIADPAAHPPAAVRSSVDVAPPQAQPRPSPQPGRQQLRRLPAKEAARDRATPHRAAPARKPPVQSAQPNVYWERENQLGFAPQLRKRTCDPATGHMPMQCYYPREGRERFPARPLE
jgi:hypothetical protein